MHILTQWPTSKVWPQVLFCLFSILLVSTTALANKPKATPELRLNHKGATLDFNNGYRLNVGGQLHFDTLLSKQHHFGREVDIRRARIVSRLSGNNWKIKVGYDTAPDRNGWRNVWAQSKVRKGTSIRVGQFITPFSMEEMQQSRHITFIERALPQAMAPSFRIGAQLSQRTKPGGIMFAVMANPIDNNSSADDGISLVLRGAFRLVKKRRRIRHLAVAVEHRFLDNDATTRISSGHEKSLLDRRYLRSDKLRHAHGYTNFNLEFAQVRNRFLFQSQFIARLTHPDTSRKRNPGHLLSYGGYGQISWLSKPATRRYSRTAGVFRSFSSKSVRDGLFELSARVSYLALDSGDVVEKETGVTLGVAWFINRNLKFSTNFSFNDIDGERRRERKSAFAMQSRIQLDL